MSLEGIYYGWCMMNSSAVLQWQKKTYWRTTSTVTFVPHGMFPENMNTLVHTPCVIAPYNFVRKEQTVQWVAVRMHEQKVLIPGI